jgi:hypothetical protein
MSLKPGVFAVTPTRTSDSAYAWSNAVGGPQPAGGPDAAPTFAALDSVTVIDAAANPKAPFTLLSFARTRSRADGHNSRARSHLGPPRASAGEWLAGAARPPGVS